MAKHDTKKTSSAERVYVPPAVTSAPRTQVVNGPYSLANMIAVISNNFAIFFLLGLCFLAGFFSGSLWTENQLLRSGRLGTATAPAAGETVPTAPTGPTAEQLKAARPVDDTDHVRGNANAKITLIEYSDFECPFCARFHPTMVEIMEEYGDDVRWVYRHYPLSFHPNAQKAGETGECVAKLQGKDAFWDFTDKIFEENNRLGGTLQADTAEKVAVAMGVNATALKTCVDSGEMAERVTSDMNDGSAAGISGTPGTIIVVEGSDPELIPGALPIDQIKPMLDKYL